MRKRLTWLIAPVVLCVLTLPCAAQTVAAPGDASRDVYAKYTSEWIGCYSGEAVDGVASVTTNQGITITVKGNLSGLTLVVMPVMRSDTQAWSWFDGMMSGKAEKFMPFDIYFVNESGNTVAVSSDVEVVISVPDGYADPVIYHLYPDGTLNKQGFAAAGKTLTFSYDGNGYIVLASAMPGGPDTGDNRNITLWLWMCGASLFGLNGTMIARRNRKIYKTSEKLCRK